jgi:hypothetical protein
VQLGTGGAADLILTPNSTIDLTLTVNTVSGQVSWSGVGAAAATFAFSATGDAAGLVPTEFDVMANAGTANAASSSADFDNFVLTAVVDPAASIKTIVAKEFSVSPNPASDVVNVSLKNNGEVITLTSAEGRVIETRVSNNATESFDVKGLNAGVYFFTVGTTTEKVIIK